LENISSSNSWKKKEARRALFEKRALLASGILSPLPRQVIELDI
jgi:hypothetical protein